MSHMQKKGNKKKFFKFEKYTYAKKVENTISKKACKKSRNAKKKVCKKLGILQTGLISSSSSDSHDVVRLKISVKSRRSLSSQLLFKAMIPANMLSSENTK